MSKNAAMNKSRLVTVAVIIAALLGIASLVGYNWYVNQPAAPGAVTEVTEANWEKEVLQSDLPVFIEFYATWCDPCKKQAPLVEEMAREYAGKVKFVKVDVDKSPNLTAASGIQGIPAMFLIKVKDKTAVGHMGFLDKEKLKELIEQGLAAQPQKQDGGQNGGQDQTDPENGGQDQTDPKTDDKKENSDDGTDKKSN